MVARACARILALAEGFPPPFSHTRQGVGNAALPHRGGGQKGTSRHRLRRRHYRGEGGPPRGTSRRPVHRARKHFAAGGGSPKGFPPLTERCSPPVRGFSHTRQGVGNAALPHRGGERRHYVEGCTARPSESWSSIVRAPPCTQPKGDPLRRACARLRRGPQGTSLAIIAPRSLGSARGTLPRRSAPFGSAEEGAILYNRMGEKEALIGL